MKELISKELKSDLNKLGIYQIAGGAIGVLLILWSIYNTDLLNIFIVPVYLFMLLFFAYSFFCGLLCIKISKNALKHSQINQFLQVFGLAISGFVFKYAAGFYLTIGLNLTESLSLDFGAGISQFGFSFNDDSSRLQLDINLVAIVLIYWINQLMKKIKTEIEIKEAASIGEA
jgi:hypothetical protein